MSFSKYEIDNMNDFGKYSTLASDITKNMVVEVRFRPLIKPRAILKVAKLAYINFITLITFIY